MYSVIIAGFASLSNEGGDVVTQSIADASVLSPHPPELG